MLGRIKVKQQIFKKISLYNKYNYTSQEYNKKQNKYKVLLKIVVYNESCKLLCLPVLAGFHVLHVDLHVRQCDHKVLELQHLM